ncbi:hypothetical protein JM658_16255 [Joostella atrarenae]|uniref:Uncharacterized protein n=1 Tax=Joostella atrarenae TaxID=679257 RepID=A0ABS9J7J5_9FLAO|nr:hypothetical protein [Joostella atrarenae]MCF8716384.1 hypothetical protein [Joostella atrarenae]
MDSYAIYKSFYDREIEKKKELDSEINMPVKILALMIGVSSFYIDSLEMHNFIRNFRAEQSIMIILVYLYILSIYSFIKSNNNFPNGFDYQELENIGDLRKLEQKKTHGFITSNSIMPKKLSFNEEMITKIIEIKDYNYKINQQRSNYIHAGKVFLVLAMILSALEFAIFYIK